MSNENGLETIQSNSPEHSFLAALRQGSPLIQCCDHCGNRFYFPRTHCPHCRCADYTWVPMGCTGTLYSYSEIPANRDQAARNVILVDLDDGFRMMSTCPACGPGELEIGMQLRARVDDSTEPPRIVFEDAKK
ncbi:Zn-ribbon domain-containing OB-fold protein [Cupriavidus sp. NPDC089707]|uniref:Zn-ribbon domain-containing OB-fold protein n=1 Tax=Cupriavidus sp. NPDC089707 TaxID=3363963 RepID=UPI00381670C1